MFLLLHFQCVFVYVTLYQGYSVNVPQNKMAYEVIMVYHLRMPFLLPFFCVFLKNLSDRT